MITGPNGCTCGFNGDCNCPFVASEASDTMSLELDDLDDDRDGYGEDNGPDVDDRDRCVLGAACCCPHLFHGAAECHSAEMAEAAAAADDPQGVVALRRALVRLLWDSVADDAMCACEPGSTTCPQCEAMAALGLEQWRGPRDAEIRLARLA